jgi:excisionase family DNA binding protein
MAGNSAVPILIPFEPEEFWSQIRIIIREEVERNKKELTHDIGVMETPGLTEKPLFKIAEVCRLFNVTKPTIYDWIKHGKLKRVKIRSRVYFLGSDIRLLIKA